MRRLFLIGAMAVLTFAPSGLAQDDGAEPTPPRSIQQRLGDVLEPVVVRRAPAREAFAWWSQSTGVPVVIHWESMAEQGVSPDAELTLELDRAPVGRVLGLMMDQLQQISQTRLIYEATPWYVQVMTKAQADRRPVLRVYDVSSLVMPIPDFTDAPSFDLRSALSNTNTGGVQGGGNRDGGLFGDTRGEREPADEPSRQDNAASLVETIRQTIEPDVWRANGGEAASIRFHRGKLIVRAPRYVQRQIGTPLPPAKSARERYLDARARSGNGSGGELNGDREPARR